MTERLDRHAGRPAGCQLKPIGRGEDPAAGHASGAAPITISVGGAAGRRPEEPGKVEGAPLLSKSSEAADRFPGEGRPQGGDAGTLEPAGSSGRRDRLEGLGWIGQVLVAPLLALLWVYSHLISPALPPSCRYFPSCSRYAAQALQLHGPLHGAWLAARRLLRCHPFCEGGPDPVPPRAPARTTSPRSA